MAIVSGSLRRGFLEEPPEDRCIAPDNAVGNFTFGSRTSSTQSPRMHRTAPKDIQRTRTRQSLKREATAYVVLWWLDQTPYVARFEDDVEAEAAARVRNATVVEVRGRGIEVPRVMDYYRRDEDGRPMPAKWKDLEADSKKRRLRVAEISA